MRANTLATDARNDYRERPYYGGPPDPGWMSGGLAITRDSDPLETSNYRTAAQRYRDAGVEPRSDGFNHWACGWVDMLTVPITRASVEVLAELREDLENYPILDDNDFAEAEWSNDHPDGHCYSEHEHDYGEPCPCGLPRG